MALSDQEDVWALHLVARTEFLSSVHILYDLVSGMALWWDGAQGMVRRGRGEVRSPRNLHINNDVNMAWEGGGVHVIII